MTFTVTIERKNAKPIIGKAFTAEGAKTLIERNKTYSDVTRIEARDSEGEVYYIWTK